MSESDKAKSPASAVEEEKPAIEVVETEMATGVETETETSNAPANEPTEKADADSSPKRLWFVRMPKPPEVPAIKVLEHEVETYQAQVKLLSETLNVHRLDRDAIREHVRTARDALKLCREAFDAKNAEVKPLRDALQVGGATSRRLKEEFADLPARSEAELDAKVDAANHRIQHESIPLNEEKKLMAEIKRLEAQRSRVKDFEASVGVVAEVRADVDRVRAELQDHEAELSVLRAERDTQQAIVNRYRDQETAADAKVEEVVAERKRVKELQDGAYAKMSELKKALRAKNDAHFANRRLSRSVRDLLAAGKTEEASQSCAQQMESIHAKLINDDAFRTEYFTQWEAARRARAEEEAELEEEMRKAGVGGGGSDSVVVDNDTGVDGGKKKSKKQAKAEVMEPAAKAQAVIAAVLEAAVIGADAPEDTATATAVKVVESKVNGDAGLTTSISTSSLHGTGGGNGERERKTRQKSVSAKSGTTTTAPEPFVEPNDTFVLPDTALHRPDNSGLSKEEERERNRRLQEEAEARKAKREAEKVKRKEKAERAKAMAETMQARLVREEVVVVEEVVAVEEASSNTVAVAAPQQHQAKPAALLPVLKAQTKPVAKRPPAGARRPGYYKHMNALFNEVINGKNSLWIGLSCIFLALVLFVLVMVRQ